MRVTYQAVSVTNPWPELVHLPAEPREQWLTAFEPIVVGGHKPGPWRLVHRGHTVPVPLVPYVVRPELSEALMFVMTLGLAAARSLPVDTEIKRLHIVYAAAVEEADGVFEGGCWRVRCGMAVQTV